MESQDNHHGDELDDPAFEPILARTEALDLPVLPADRAKIAHGNADRLPG